MNDLNLCLEVVQGHVNHSSVNIQNYLSLRLQIIWYTGTQLCIGNVKQANKYFSLKVGVA